VTISVLIFAALSTGSLILLGFSLWLQGRTTERLSGTFSSSLSTALTSSAQTQQALTALVEKGQALVASGDALTYQAIQSMSVAEQYTPTSYDPSDEAEVERIRERSPGLEDVNGPEDLGTVLSELGID
jgi:hypothetical protein